MAKGSFKATVLYPIAQWPRQLLEEEKVRESGLLVPIDVSVEGLDTASTIYYLAFPRFRQGSAAVILEADIGDAKACRKLARTFNGPRGQIAQFLQNDLIHCLAEAMVQCKVPLPYEKGLYQGNWLRFEFLKGTSGPWRPHKMWACQGLPQYGKSNDIELVIAGATLEGLKQQIRDKIIREELDE